MKAVVSETWAPDYLAEFVKRAKLIRKIRADETLWSALKLFYGSGADGCIRWIEDWCVTYDPRNTGDKPKTMPFLLFRRQTDMVHFILGCLQDKEAGLIEKCRDFGATWLCCAISVWLWLFQPGTSIGWGSRKANLVDELGNPDSIFEKMRIIINHLPDFMLPAGFAPTKHMPSMKIINPLNGSTIAGETGENIGRGGRSSIYFKDESAHYEHPEKIEAALGDNTDVQIDISSVNGTGNPFYRRRKAGQVWERDKLMKKGWTRVLILDWRHNPLKSQAWYDQRRAKNEREGTLHIFAQEVDRDYAGSVVGVIIPAKYVRAAIDAHIKLRFPLGGAKRSALDVADGGRDKNAQSGIVGVTLKFLAQWPYADDVGISAMTAINNCKVHGFNEFYYDSIGIGAGVKAQTNRMIEDGQIPSAMRIHPWNAAANPLNPDDRMVPSDHNSPLVKEVVKNLKSQGWLNLRQRFEKTYRAVVLGHHYPWQELISIDSTIDHLEELVTELSQPVWAKQRADGKLLVDKAPDGTPSPNLADVVMMGYHPVRQLSILEVV